jgi:hypothetical protein
MTRLQAARLFLVGQLCVATWAVPVAHAATTVRPDFKLPLQCGTEWMASTYDGHGAAAAGYVSVASATSGTVTIDHGGGWATRYLHMSDIRVAVGRRVSEGQWVGRVSDVGRAYGPHLHFEVRRDGVMVPPVVDGVTVAPTPTAPARVRSTNCLPGVNGLWFANTMVRAPDGTVDYVTPGGARYWVPNQTIVACLQQAGVPLRSVSSAEFAATPRNPYGDPGGRWADCATAYLGWMIRGSGPAVYYVASTGFKYHVPNEATVMCLGGWSSVRTVSDGRLASLPTNPFGQLATCQTPLFGRMIKGTQDRVDYVDTRGRRYHVPNSDIVRCLGGTSHILNVRNARRDSLIVNPFGALANCNAPLIHRLVRAPSGQVDYVTGAVRRYWVPNSQTVGCLGGWSSTISLRDGRFQAIPRNSLNEWANCDTRWKP